MKSSYLVLLFCFFSVIATAQTKSQPTQAKAPVDTLQIVEASCGECKFGMKGKGCNLAIRINGKAYFVDGTNIDDHGDAHADDGFCSKIRKAKVSGTIVNDRFVATSFKLLPEVVSKP